MVRMKRLELLRLAAQEPKSCMSTNSITSACDIYVHFQGGIVPLIPTKLPYTFFPIELKPGNLGGLKHVRWILTLSCYQFRHFRAGRMLG